MRISLLSLALLALLACAGCNSSRSDRAKNLPSYELHNVARMPLPAGFTRIALLPIVSDPEQGLGASLDSIKQAMTEELLKTKKYEVIVVGSDELHDWTGMRQLTSLDVWPEELRTALAERQIDGVMLIEITALKGYPPIALGLKSRLIGLGDRKTYWAVDELFDAASPSVFAAAKRFESGMLMNIGKAKSQGSIEISPSQFAKYAAYTIFETLP